MGNRCGEGNGDSVLIASVVGIDLRDSQALEKKLCISFASRRRRFKRLMISQPSPQLIEPPNESGKNHARELFADQDFSQKHVWPPVASNHSSDKLWRSQNKAPRGYLRNM